jgi:hypothetical protein
VGLERRVKLSAVFDSVCQRLQPGGCEQAGGGQAAWQAGGERLSLGCRCAVLCCAA